MTYSGVDTRIKIQQIIENHLPEFVLSESQNASDFLRQYYISQEYQGASSDILNNLDQYLKLDNLTPDVISQNYHLTSDLFELDDEVYVNSTIGFPSQYGLLKINNEIITYTGITTNSFTGCIRGFSGISDYINGEEQSELVFEKTNIESHNQGDTVQNLSNLFLKEFYRKIKYYLTPGLEDVDFIPELNVGSFIKESKSFYATKGTEESFRILFNVLYGVDPKVVDLEQYLIKPSSAKYLRRKIILTELISGNNPTNLSGQTIFSSDNSASAPVSEVEIFTRSGKSFYKLSIFEGYDERSLIEGEFRITPSTKVIESVSLGDNKTITVDSTIGFPNSGTLISGNNIISYTDKSVNQFFNCSNINEDISVTDDIRLDEYIYGYENGDLDLKVELRITGSISEFIPISDIELMSENDKIYITSLGDYIEESDDKTKKDIIFNSWIYNTSSRYQIDSSESNTKHRTKEIINKSSLKRGDSVDILLRNTESLVATATINLIDQNILELENFVNISGINLQSVDIDIRRKLDYSTSNVNFKYENILSNVLNTYNENDEYIYIASNSTPKNIDVNRPIISISNASSSFISNNTISFDLESLPFLTGDEVVYISENSNVENVIGGLESGNSYFIEKLSGFTNKIRLYLSRSFIVDEQFIEITPNNQGTPHTFYLKSTYDKYIVPKKNLLKIPLENTNETGKNEKTPNDKSVGVLINGVEISNYKSSDKVYYGPLSSISILNFGSDYDVINPPRIDVISGSGQTALVNPQLSGSLVSVFLENPNIPINYVNSLSVVGGNGTGARVEPIVERRFVELEFLAGIGTIIGVNENNDEIVFSSRHNLKNGEALVYNSNGNQPIGIGSYLGSNALTGQTLSDGSVYYSENVNSSTIKLYRSLSDYNLGINTIGFTTEGLSGIHKFRLLNYKNVLADIKVLNFGENYQNKKLIVKSDSIDINSSTVKFKDHGFNEGDEIKYLYDETPISGLSTTTKYKLIRISSDEFRLSDVGKNNQTEFNYTRRNYVTFQSNGSGYQTFKYPDIEIIASVSYAQTGEQIRAIPVVRGKIDNVQIYEPGNGYGSDIVNFHKKPFISIKTGKNASLRPIIVGGRIVDIEIGNSGSEYYSSPDLVVTGDGVGAKLYPVISNNKIIDVKIIKSGINYNENTTIQVIPSGNGFKCELNVRELTLNQTRNGYEVLKSYEDGLFYSVAGYTEDIKENFQDNIDEEIVHSPIIGWAYDGNPIYGPYGHSIPNDTTSPIKLLNVGYAKSEVFDRPPGFSDGVFIEDYYFNDSGDLDTHNGRFAKTPEFSNGVYAYYVGIKTDSSLSNSLVPQFPYFVGDTFKSKVLPDIDLTQSYDFSNSNLLRNTFPYRVGNLYSKNDFIAQSEDNIRQICSVDSTTKGSIDSLSIISAGDGYKSGDKIVFDSSNTSGSNISAEVLEVKGKNISSINLGISTYSGVITKETSSSLKVYTNTEHEFLSGDTVTISGLSTNIINLGKQHKIFVPEYSTFLLNELPSVNFVGFVTDIYVANIDNNLKPGSHIGIGTEKVKVIEIFDINKIIRIERSLVGVSHSLSETVKSLVDYFTINFESNEVLNSYKNNANYFNPLETVGFGTISGITTNISYKLGELTLNRELETQSIYIPNHKFKTNQEIIIRKPNLSNSITVSNESDSSEFDLPYGESQIVYVINKSKNYIGIVTQVGLTTTNGLYFRNYTSVGVSSDYKYSLETIFPEITGNIEKIVSNFGISTAHNLRENDIVNINILPNSTAGVGNSDYISLSYRNNKLLVDPIGFSSENVLLDQNIITINSHGLKTGDKVFYDSSDELISGVSTNSYYVYAIDANNIKLSEKYSDVFLDIPSFISIGSSGGALQSISKINPQINPTIGNNLKFNLSDSSLSGYTLKIFYDVNFINEFNSTELSSSFNVVRTGTPGITTNASLTILYDNTIAENLYYALEKSGEIVSPDNDVVNASRINYIASKYSGKFNIFNVGISSFSVNLLEVPEITSYTQNQLLNSNYVTSSSNASGSISKIKIINPGNQYDRLPIVEEISSENGVGALIIPQTKTIGKINEVSILNEGFSYPSDTTLRPRAVLPTISNLLSNNEVSRVEITYGGNNYYSEPKLVLVDSITKEIIDNGALRPILSNNSIIDVEIVSSPKGLRSNEHEIYTLNNTNGVGISTISYNSFTGDVSCTLFTPIAGFPTQNQPFEVGDFIFVEGIENSDPSSIGFNSEDYGYIFFKVTDFINTNPAILKFNLSEYTTNAGTPRLTQTKFATIVNKKIYPIFKVYQNKSVFEVGEKIRVYLNGSYQQTDLFISEFNTDYIKIVGTYPLKNDYLIKGEKTGSISRIAKSKEFYGGFSFDYYSPIILGWKDEIGKISVDTQVIPDNDYYQNLSYTVKSPIEYEKLIDPVNRLVHTAGLKNFADLGITTESRYSVNNASIATIVVDLLEENRVDTVSSFDSAIDFDVRDIGSKFLDLQFKQLSNYIKCKSNRVLQIDDISGSFSSKSFSQEEYVDIITYSRGLRYSKFYVQTSGIGTNEYQFDDIIVLNNLDNTYTFNRGSISNNASTTDEFTSDKYVDVSGYIDEFSNLSLRVYPEDPFEKSYEFKVYRNYFNTSPSGIGSTSFGFVSLTSKTQSIPPNQSSDIIGISTNTVNSVYAEIVVINNVTNGLNFFEVILDHDGENTSLSEFYFDTTNSESGFSNDSIGSFRSEISNNLIKLTFDNLTNNNLTIKSRIIGIGTTSSGIGTYRFKEEEQPDGTERSIRFDCNYIETSGSPISIITSRRGVDRTTKSLVRVKNNDKVSLHEIIFLNDDDNTFILPKYFLSVNNTTGIGTFGSQINGLNAEVIFYPDQDLSGTFQIQTYNEVIYSDIDLLNEAPDLDYGTIIESLITSQFNGVNSGGNDRLNFDLLYQNTPIFKKNFNPLLPSTLDLSSGTFSIKNHFFNTNEELIYTDGSTFEDISSSPLEIPESLTGGTVFVGDVISGFSTITGISTTDNLNVGQIVVGSSIPSSTQIVSIGTDYKYFEGTVASGGSDVITGVANTSILTIGSGIFSGDGTSYGDIISIGISSIRSSVSIPEGNSIVYYSDEVGIAVSLSNVSMSSTFRNQYSSGILTSICPSTVYALKVDNDRFRITATKNSGIALTFTSYGNGNYHSFEMKKKNEKSLITVDNVVQYPVRYANIQHYLENNGGSVSDSGQFLSLSGISSIRPNDLLKINSEYIKVVNVGFGTTGTGPVSGIGTFNVVYGIRGFFGSISTTHTDGSLINVYRGNYNIEGSTIYFSDPPKGTGANDGTNNSNLNLPRSSFNGRVFLRQDYTDNIIYDDLSDQFNGIGQTYVVKSNGNDITNIEPGSGLLYVNEMFQTPTTENNEGNNYSLDIDVVNKQTKITFSGIRSSETNELIISEDDVNQNQLPRGGIIVSLGSTSGLGFAPLVGASVTAVVSSGAIQSVGFGSTDILGSGYYNHVSVAITDTTGSGAIITPTIGIGGTLSFTVIDGGSGYTNPKIIVSEPSYSNLPVTGVFRVGVGSTSLTGIGMSISLEVGPTYRTGIGSTYFEVKSFSLSKSGYGFKNGDIIKPVGLVTALGLNSPLEEFEITILETFTDSSALIQFGELDFIDSISNLQDGIRRRFPLYRNSNLLSFETDESDSDSSLIDLDAVLVIFINGVLQEPKVSYTFDGGTAFTFAEPPKPDDQIDIFFYRGTRDIDSFITGVRETIKVGDNVRLSNSVKYNDPYGQESRTVFEILSSDSIETNIYSGVGINTINYKAISWTKQKRDKIINSLYVSKARDSLSSLVFPTSKLISNFNSDDLSLFVDNAELYDYEETTFGETIQEFDLIIVEQNNPVSAAFTAIVSSGSLSDIIILDGGFGYTPGETIPLKISSPIYAGGTRATGNAIVSAAGTVSSVSISNSGLGYTHTSTPQVIAALPDSRIELLDGSTFIQGFSGIITGITTSSGIGGHPLAMTFYLEKESGTFSTLVEGYPIFVNNTTVGNGIISVDNNDSDVIGIGTTFSDSIYKVHSISSDGNVAIVTSNILSSSITDGIDLYGEIVGRFSWGRISGFSRSQDPVSFAVTGYTINSGLTTFPQIQRRGYGLRDTGSIKK